MEGLALAALEHKILPPMKYLMEYTYRSFALQGGASVVCAFESTQGKEALAAEWRDLCRQWVRAQLAWMMEVRHIRQEYVTLAVAGTERQQVELQLLHGHGPERPKSTFLFHGHLVEAGEVAGFRGAKVVIDLPRFYTLDEYWAQKQGG